MAIWCCFISKSKNYRILPLRAGRQPINSRLKPIAWSWNSGDGLIGTVRTIYLGGRFHPNLIKMNAIAVISWIDIISIRFIARAVAKPLSGFNGFRRDCKCTFLLDSPSQLYFPITID